MINTAKSKGGFTKQIEHADFIKDSINKLPNDTLKGYAHFVTALAYFDSESKPYQDVKQHLKMGLVALRRSQSLEERS